MLHFEGDKDFPRPPADVAARLSDARFLVRCIPDAEVLGTPTTDRAECKVRPGVAFVRGTLTVTLQVLEVVPATSTRLALRSKAIGASSDVEVVLTFAPTEAGTRVHWTADVKTLTGLLKLVPQGLIRGAAQKVISDVWARVETALSEPEA
jgi:carbon monoxide dehydrogenase subunit G